MQVERNTERTKKAFPREKGALGVDSPGWVMVPFRAGHWERSKDERLLRETAVQQGNLTCLNLPMKKLSVYSTHHYYLKYTLFSDFCFYQ